MQSKEKKEIQTHAFSNTAFILTYYSHAMESCSEPTSDVLIVWERQVIVIIIIIIGFTYLTLKLSSLSATEERGNC